MGFNSAFKGLTLIVLTWRIWWAPNNVSKWQMGFNSAFKGLNKFFYMCIYLELYTRNYILEIQRDIIINVRISWYISPGILFLLNKICTPSTDLKKKNPQKQNVMKIRPVGAQLYIANRQTDTHDEAKSCFCKITNALKHERNYSYTSAHPYHQHTPIISTPLSGHAKEHILFHLLQRT